jgi:hypothetical protein
LRPRPQHPLDKNHPIQTRMDRSAGLALSHRMIETTWQCYPKDGLRFLRMTGEAALPMRILNEDKTTDGNVPDLSVTGLILD